MDSVNAGNGNNVNGAGNGSGDLFSVKSFGSVRSYDNETRNMIESFCISSATGYDYTFPSGVTFSDTIDVTGVATFNGTVSFKDHITLDSGKELRLGDATAKLYSSAAGQIDAVMTLLYLQGEVKVKDDNKVKFRDDDIYIQSDADTKLKIAADGEVNIITPAHLFTGGVNGAATTSTVANAYLLAVALDALRDFQVVTFKAHAASTAASTLDVNGKGAKKLLLGSDNATQVTVELVLNGSYMAVYNKDLDAGNGAWVVMNI